jgi:hypothetical protein
VLVDPVDEAEGAAAGVMIDVDEGAAFEVEEAGAGDAVTFEQDGGDGSGWVDLRGRDGVMDAVEVGKCGVGGRDGIGEEDVGLAAELVENFGEGEDGADGVTVWAGVGGQKEAWVASEDRQ